MIAKILFIIVVFASVGITALVLMQQSSGDAGSAFGGGGSSQSLFGSRGSANFMSRMTSVLVTLFFAASLGLAYTYAKQNNYDANEGQESVLNAVNIQSDLPSVPVEASNDLNIDTDKAEVPVAPQETEIPTVPQEEASQPGLLTVPE